MSAAVTRLFSIGTKHSRLEGWRIGAIRCRHSFDWMTAAILLNKTIHVQASPCIGEKCAANSFHPSLVSYFPWSSEAVKLKVDSNGFVSSSNLR